MTEEELIKRMKNFKAEIELINSDVSALLKENKSLKQAVIDLNRDVWRLERIISTLNRLL
jgi:predicted  nucleic acid-binding Zn-ribbon protein